MYKLVNETKEPESIIMREILLDAKDNANEEVISVNYSLYNGTILIKSGVTRTDSLVQTNIPDKYVNVNIKGQAEGYYDSISDSILNKHTITMEKIGNIFVNHTGDLNKSQGEITLNISTDSIVKEISICVRWTGNMLEVTHPFYSKVRELRTQLDCEYEGYTWTPRKVEKKWFKKDKIVDGFCNIDAIETLPPHRLNQLVDSCYLIEQTITKDIPFQVSFDYRSYSNEENEIKFYVIDSELNAQNRFMFEDGNKNDVGALDYVYQI